MKIALSSPDDPRGRHIVLVCSKEEAWTAQAAVTEEVLQHRAAPVKERRGENILFRFNMRYLDRLSLTFPMAELSDGVHNMLKKAEMARLRAMPVPTCSWPGLENGELHDYQKIAADLIVRGEIDFLNDGLGLGKTIIALAAIRKLKAFPALVVCPNSAKFTSWKDDIEKFFPGVSYAIVDGTPAQRAEAIEKRADITVINFEGIRAKPIHEDDNPYKPIVGYTYSNPGLFDFVYDFVVIDESHRAKNPNAQVTYGFFQLIGEQWLMMSGTPILNRPEEIWTVLHKVYPEEYPSYERFIREIGIFNGDRIVAYRPDALANLREFLASISLRRRREMIRDDLPQVVTVDRVVKQSAEERKLYERIRDELLLELEDGTTKNIMGVLPQITRLKQAAFSPELYGGSKKSSKIIELKSIVEELIASGEKAIIFSQWSKATRIIQRELAEYNPAYVTGEIKLKDRAAEIKRFMEDDDCKLYIATISASREAINLGIATYVIFTDSDWTPAAMDQAVGRSAAGGLRGAHLGSDAKVHVIELQAEDTIEQRIGELLQKKRNITNRLIERDGGKKIEKITITDIRSLL